MFTKAKCDLDPNACEWTLREQSPSFDKSFIYVERIPNTDLLPVVSTGTVLGEFWVAYADQSADTNGKFRLTANQKATMSADLFLHVTMQVDMVSTSRRYPQILISDRPAPVQDTLEQGHTLIVQPRGDWPVGYQLQVCNMRTWDVNNQCPDFEDTRRMNRPGGPAGQLAPVAELGELGSPDHRAVFDVYASTKRVYLFLEGQPYTCADMPSGSLPSGSVTVTWGDVLYHSGADGGGVRVPESTPPSRYASALRQPRILQRCAGAGLGRECDPLLAVECARRAEIRRNALHLSSTPRFFEARGSGQEAAVRVRVLRVDN